MDDLVAQQLFDIAKQIRQIKYSTNESISYQLLPRMHLIRVPKASSSSLSAITRRMVGCNPPGPCCRYPGDPVGSCPAPKTSPERYLCSKVIGCTSHHPFIEILDHPPENRQLYSISMMREPISRSISAFAYHPPHTIVKKRYPECIANPYSNECFQKYLSNHKFKNIVVKMLSGSFPYNVDDEVCKTKCQQANFSEKKNPNKRVLAVAKTDSYMKIASSTNRNNVKLKTKLNSKNKKPKSVPAICVKGCQYSYELALENLNKLTLMGISELWSLSILLLYAKIPQIEPKLSEILLESTKSGNFSRMHNGDAYKNFKKVAKNEFSSELHKQNSFDIQLYEVSLRKLCTGLHTEGIWKYEVVKQVWKNGIPSQYTDGVPQCKE